MSKVLTATVQMSQAMSELYAIAWFEADRRRFEMPMDVTLTVTPDEVVDLKAGLLLFLKKVDHEHLLETAQSQLHVNRTADECGVGDMSELEAMQENLEGYTLRKNQLFALYAKLVTGEADPGTVEELSDDDSSWEDA